MLCSPCYLWLQHDHVFPKVSINNDDAFRDNSSDKTESWIQKEKAENVSHKREVPKKVEPSEFDEPVAVKVSQPKKEKKKEKKATPPPPPKSESEESEEVPPPKPKAVKKKSSKKAEPAATPAPAPLSK